MRSIFTKLIILSLMATGLTACASSPPDTNNDPYESFNRKMFAVEQTLDHYVLEPTAKGYTYVPQPVRRSVGHFFRNLAAPVTLANDLLQGEGARAGTTASRFGINTTIGILGFFDPATRLGFERHTEDFGQTLATYGVGAGPYLYIPGLGPRPPRDLLGFIVDWNFSPTLYIADDDRSVAFASYALSSVNTRAANIDTIDEIERGSVDFYATVRSLYRQNRESEIANGVTNVDDLPDIDYLDDF